MRPTCTTCGIRQSPGFPINSAGLCPICVDTARRRAVDLLPPADRPDDVLCCPDCERPNQFGEICRSCRAVLAAEEEYASKHGRH